MRETFYKRGRMSMHSGRRLIWMVSATLKVGRLGRVTIEKFLSTIIRTIRRTTANELRRAKWI